jgi:hypothetical protein
LGIEIDYLGAKCGGKDKKKQQKAKMARKIKE